MRRTVISLIILINIVIAPGLLAQQVIGGVVRSGNEPLPYATVSLKPSPGGEVISFAYTDEEGYFKLKPDTEFSIAVLKTEIMGYKTYTDTISSANLPLKGLNIVLSRSSNELDEVKVVAEKRNAISLKNDKLIYDVEQAGIAGTSDGLEVMRQIPGISLDKDENIQFRGSSGVKIMINGKDSFLKGEALREFVRSLNGEDIASVEIIAQPSARYEAEGTTGIININLKRKLKGGITGRVYSTVGYGEYFKNKNGANLYYSDSLWNLNLNAYYNKNNSVNHRRVEQVIDNERRIVQNNEWLPKGVSRSINFGAERYFGNNQSLSTSWRFTADDSDEYTFGNTIETREDSLYRKVTLDKNADIPTRNLTGNLYYQNSSEDMKNRFEAQLNYSYYNRENENMLETGYPVNPEAEDGLNLFSLNKTRYNIFSAKADYETAISSKISLETGVKYSSIDTRYQNNYDADKPEALLISEDLLDNTLNYGEQLAAAYSQAGLELENWNLMAGLRAEYISYEGSSKNEEFSDDYVAWFPSFSVNYKKNGNQYQFAYSRRIGRPDYKDLNPFYEYMDPYTLGRGNPQLRPEFYHSFQLNYTHRSGVSASLYGYLYKDKITRVIDFDKGENYTSLYRANASKGSRFGTSINIPVEPAEWWKIQLSLNGYYMYEKSDIPEYKYDDGGFGYDLQFFQNFDLKKNWLIKLTGFYSWASQSGNTSFNPAYDLSLSISKEFFDDKLKAELSASDILKRSYWDSVIEQNDVTTYWTNKWETRKFSLTITYNFGNNDTKEVKEASIEEETGRM